MYITEIWSEWLPPNYDDCGWYLDCHEDACLLNDNVIRQMNDTKRINLRNTINLQTQIV